MKRSHTMKLLSILLLGAMLTAGCSSNAANTSSSTTTTNATSESTAAVDQTTGAAAAAVELASASAADQADFDENDSLTIWRADSATTIAFSGSVATVTGSGAKAEGGVVTISTAGTYVVSGTIADGQLVVDAPEDADVHLVLNGTQITNNDGPAVHVKEAGKAIITLQEGTDNSLSDGATYADTSEEAPTATLFSKGDVTINGTGKLTVTGNAKDGMTSKDDLKIMSGMITVKASDDGVVGKDLVAVKDGTITVEAGGDGVKTTNETDADKGYVAITGGTFHITSQHDGIQAASSILIADGAFDIVSGGGNAKSTKTHEEQFGGRGFQDQAQTQTDTTQATEETESASAKGLKGTANVAIAGGSFTIDAADDAIHSNANIAISGGQYSIASGDDGIHADTALAIASGTIAITKSYEGIESADIAISGGEIHVTASDDGVNVGGGNDGSGATGGDMFASTGGVLNISGGYVYVDSEGDGLDSNGNVVMTGGTAVVNGPTMNGNAPLDYNGTFEQSGGTLVAAGSAGMAQAPSDTSKQLALMMTFPSTLEAGTLVSVTDSAGQTIAAFQPTKTFGSFVLSSAALASGESYTISTGGTSSGNATDGLYESGAVSGSTKVVTFEMGEKVTYVNESGLTTAASSHGGMGGGGGRGMGGGRGGMRGTPPTDMPNGGTPPADTLPTDASADDQANG
ncbi:carbohydrate-binding domain-containing protein [Paenibacillus xanthanilyticus]|uniref:Carbohydrate-binding domain-containing protein n=1 Tax=Paenibacillus xanthanilyticus TaxID=1783531 RepID=A0ABV8K2S4_9BACL